jgi:hypothetical protein
MAMLKVRSKQSEKLCFGEAGTFNLSAEQELPSPRDGGE